MDLVILIIAVLILSKTTSKENQKSLLMVAGPLAGIAYFIIWPYAGYYFTLQVYDKTLINILLALILVIILAISRALIIFKMIEVIQIISISLFLALMVISYSYEIDIKDEIARQSGYFKPELPVDNSFQQETRTVYSPNEAYSLQIPRHWLQSKEKVTHHPYYTPTDNIEGIIEFRPRCYDKQMVNITEIIQKSTINNESSKQAISECYIWKFEGYACKTVHTNNETIERVIWIAASKETGRMLSLDFITNIKQPASTALIDSIFNSLKLTGKPASEYNCVYPVEWF